MKLTKLIINNFGSVEHAELCLADKGLVSIEGLNEDATGSESNGAGKSTIINSILWCLYSSYGKIGLADDVVHSKAGKDCFVQCEWREANNNYTITRYRKHRKQGNRVTVSLNGKDITKAGATAVQDQINEIMGANETIFRASCFAQQENPLDIPAMTDSKLKALLEDCLPIDDLTPLYKEASANVTSQESQLGAREKEVERIGWEIQRTKSDLQDILFERLKWQETEDNKVSVLNNQIKLKNIARGIALGLSNKGTLEKDIEELKFRIDAIGYSDKNMASYQHNEAEREVDRIKRELASPVTSCATCGQDISDWEIVAASLKEELKQAEAKRDKLRDAAKVAAYNYTQKTTLEREKTALEAELRECIRQGEAADRLGAEMRLLEAQKAPAGANPHTPTVERLRTALKGLYAKETEEKLKLKEEQERLELLKAVQLTFSPKGLRYHMLEKLAPVLTDSTNKYLSILTDDAIKAVWSTVTKTANGDYKEKFSIEAQMEGRTNFGLLSGGEKRKVRLACFFALQDLIASEATKNIELWCGDEIDVALDPAGMERLMGVLAEKAKTKSTILVISHNEMREWIPNSALVTRKDGVSTITGYLNVD